MKHSTLRFDKESALSFVVPNGSVFRLQQLRNGSWQRPTNELSMVYAVVNGLDIQGNNPSLRASDAEMYQAEAIARREVISRDENKSHLT